MHQARKRRREETTVDEGASVGVGEGASVGVGEGVSAGVSAGVGEGVSARVGEGVSIRRREVDELESTVTDREIDIGDHMITFQLAGDLCIQKVLRDNLYQHYVSAKGHHVLTGTSKMKKNHSENKQPPPPHIQDIIQALFRMVEGGLFRAFNVKRKGVQYSIIFRWRYTKQQQQCHQDLHLDFGKLDEGVRQAADWFSVVVPLNTERTLRYLTCGKADDLDHTCTVDCTTTVRVQPGCAAAFKSKFCWHGGLDNRNPDDPANGALFGFFGPNECVCVNPDGTATYEAELGLDQYVMIDEQMRRKR